MDAKTIKAMCDRWPARQLKDNDGNAVERWMTGPVRLSFSSFEETQKFKGKATDFYGCTLIFPAVADISVLRAAVKDAAKAKFKDKARALFDTKGFQPFYENSTKEKYDGFKDGGVHIGVKSKFQPDLFDKDLTPISPSNPAIYDGCWVRAKLSIYAYDGKENGVRFGLVSLQKLADDEEFKGSASTDGFEAADEVAEKTSKAPAMAGGEDW